MTTGATFAADWLDLREPFDAAARNPDLAARFIAALPPRPVLIDLGAGGGSLFRWLAPRIGGDQAWLLVDADAGLLEHALAITAAWADVHGFAVRSALDGLTLRTQGGIWRLTTRVADLADLAPLDIGQADAIVCSALLDLVSARWIARLAAATRGPVLACLNVDGHDATCPPHAADRAVTTGFRRDQARDKGFGPALGRHATAAVRAAFTARGFTVVAAPSPWRIPPDAAAMLAALVHGHAVAATLRLPAARGAIAHWQSTRLRQIAAGRLAMRVGHRDVLALPHGDP